MSDDAGLGSAIDLEDIAGEGRWHLEEMDGWFYFGAEIGGEWCRFRLYADGGSVALEQYDGDAVSEVGHDAE